MESPSVPSQNTGTTGSMKNREDRIDMIMHKVKNIREVLENPYMPVVANQADVQLILLGLNSVEDRNFNAHELEAFNVLIIAGEDAPESTTRWVNLANSRIKELVTLYQHHLELENAIPPPSLYARHSIWVDWQKKEDAILCFRPSGKQGLPLCVLDDVFREFQHQATAPLPLTDDAAQAMSAAYNLCHAMPDHFAKENDRSKAFDKCLKPIFPLKSWHAQVPIDPETERHEAKVDRTYELDGMILIIREDKLESGTGYDVYMQIARDYQLFVKKTNEDDPARVKQGAPVFLLCLLGPMLLICGGFHDTESTIVEPLAEPCLLFDDLLHNRQEVLARQLFALKTAVNALGDQRHADKKNVHLAGVPRVYTTYITEDGVEQRMTVLRPLESSPPRSLLFVAAENSPDEKLVKLVRKYGAKVHRLLAKSQFAPVLYGHSSLQGAPTAYVMELLRSPTNGKPGWVTLWEFFRSKEPVTRYSKAIETTLGEILGLMERANMVHGDLRPNNIMLEVHRVHDSYIPICSGEKANLRVIDFDWAGESGSVRYPLQRNQEIAWPGGPGDSITSQHDRDLVKAWWHKQFSLEFQSSDSDMVE
ncbi:hypothetical protein FS837_010740 [Tulasnella sp. UAMH 9824]|nr:hypothetical protein FS837_010740 [Tulasnella sp. UAMH 9824]